MKKNVLVSVCFVVFFTNGFAQQRFKGEIGVSSFGGMIGYVIESESPAIGIDFRHNILDRLRIAPSIFYVFEKKDIDLWYFNTDFHYLGRITKKATLYPIGGFGLSSLHYRETKGAIFREAETKLRLGINLGFGGEIRVSKDIITGIEFKYHWTKLPYNQAMLLARIAYYF